MAPWGNGALEPQSLPSLRCPTQRREPLLLEGLRWLAGIPHFSLSIPAAAGGRVRSLGSAFAGATAVCSGGESLDSCLPP